MLYFSILIPILSICLNVVTQVFFCKSIVRKAVLKSIYIGFTCGFAGFILGEFIAYRKSTVEWLPLFCVNFIIYGCLSLCYFTFINMGETARRIRLLRELYDAPEGLTKEQLLSRYNAQEIVEVRLSRLLDNNQIVLRDGRFYVSSPAMLFISKTIVLIKLILSGKRGEFDNQGQS